MQQNTCKKLKMRDSPRRHTWTLEETRARREIPNLVRKEISHCPKIGRPKHLTGANLRHTRPFADFLGSPLRSAVCVPSRFLVQVPRGRPLCSLFYLFVRSTLVFDTMAAFYDEVCPHSFYIVAPSLLIFQTCYLHRD